MHDISILTASDPGSSEGGTRFCHRRSDGVKLPLPATRASAAEARVPSPPFTFTTEKHEQVGAHPRLRKNDVETIMEVVLPIVQTHTKQLVQRCLGSRDYRVLAETFYFLKQVDIIVKCSSLVSFDKAT